ncbi:MAG: YqgE/AlgH family protein [Planctomycetales bacterium]
MPDSLRGQLLIAGRSLRDPNFFRSVVLIVEHGSEGAMGLIINRPSGITVAQALKQHFDLPETGEMVHVGGPVENNALFILHNAEDLDATEKPVLEGTFLGTSPDTFESVIRRAAEQDPNLKFRVYFGCAGWAPQQLEGELGRNDWLVYPAAVEHVFHPEPYAVWEQVLAAYRKSRLPVPGWEGDPGLN